jgi:hypothetical protein
MTQIEPTKLVWWRVLVGLVIVFIVCFGAAFLMSEVIALIRFLIS